MPIGHPIKESCLFLSSLYIRDHTVVSVGPYILNDLSNIRSSFSTRSLSIASPPQSATVSLPHSNPLLKSVIHNAGVACIKSGEYLLITCFSFAISLLRLSDETITLPPHMSGRKISNTEISNEYVVRLKKDCFSLKPSSSFILRRKLTILLCEI